MSLSTTLQLIVGELSITGFLFFCWHNKECTKISLDRCRMQLALVAQSAQFVSINIGETNTTVQLVLRSRESGLPQVFNLQDWNITPPKATEILSLCKPPDEMGGGLCSKDVTISSMIQCYDQHYPSPMGWGIMISTMLEIRDSNIELNKLLSLYLSGDLSVNSHFHDWLASQLDQTEGLWKRIWECAQPLDDMSNQVSAEIGDKMDDILADLAISWPADEPYDIADLKFVGFV